MSSKDKSGSIKQKCVLSLAISIFIGALVISDNNKNQYSNINVMGHAEYAEMDEQKDTSISIGGLQNKNDYTILENITGKANAYNISVNDESVGYVYSEQEANSILYVVKNIHIDRLNLEEEDIISIDMKANLKIEKSKVKLNEISTPSEIAEKIYDFAMKEPSAINISVRIKEKIQEKISPDTITIYDDTLYKGESKEEYGEVGVKEVFKEITYNNAEIAGEDIIEETVVLKPKNSIVRKGSKNPYYSGVAFLTKPTSQLVMTSGYGPRWQSFHKGIDISGSVGDNVFAAMDGEVTYAQYNEGGYGNLIMIQHEDNMITYYAHLNNIGVKVGDKISKGQIVGGIGNTGNSTGPHLHFELRVNGKHVDPEKYIIQ